jgi:hypothetical protein
LKKSPEQIRLREQSEIKNETVVQRRLPEQIHLKRLSEKNATVATAVVAKQSLHEKKSIAERKEEHELSTSCQDQWIRICLIACLVIISVGWLCFTGFIVFNQGCRCVTFCLSDSVMNTFLTTSLGTILGLWSIGLAYYFFLKK